jgi:hypothetical protein
MYLVVKITRSREMLWKCSWRDFTAQKSPYVIIQRPMQHATQSEVLFDIIMMATNVFEINGSLITT